jgi:hypothetical protein
MVGNLFKPATSTAVRYFLLHEIQEIVTSVGICVCVNQDLECIIWSRDCSHQHFQQRQLP